MTDPVEVYSSDRISTRWAVVDALHPNAVGHRGVDYRLPNGGGSPVPAYERGTVVSTPFSSILGYCTVLRYADGVHGYWAHLRQGTRPDIGTVLEPGDLVGLAATGGTWLPQMDPNFPGTAWAGVHIHTGIGPLLSSVFSGVTYDPLPRIQSALYALAGAGTGTGLAGGGITVIVALDGNNDSADDKAIRAILQRSFKFHVRENETTGATVWERFAAVLDAVGKVATLATKQDKRREEINQRNEDLHKALGAQIAAGVPVTVKVDESFADLVASKVAGKVTPGASRDEVASIVAEQFAKVFVVP